jgi:phospholipid/cholesterol/gamma-HCH transport system substrate-binding protein
MKPFRERNPVVIGAASITVLALLLLAAFRAQDLPLIGGGDTYYAAFEEAGGLKADDAVLMAGVRVGAVDGVELEDGQVVVEFSVDTDAPFGNETGAEIEVRTLLGAKYLNLVPDGEGQLEAGAMIPTSRTTSPFDVTAAFEGLAETSNELDTAQLTQSLTVLADLTRNTPDEFRNALAGVSALSSNLAARDDQINSLLTNLERLSRVLGERDDDIITLMRDSDVLFEALLDRRQQINDVLVATQQLSRQLTKLVRQSRDDLAPALDQLQSVLDVINKNSDNLDASLRLLAPFYRVFANTLGNGPWFDTFIQNLPPVPNLGSGLEILTGATP